MPSDLTRPIIGIQNRTAQEVFDIMCDRFRALPTITPAEVGGLVDAQTEARAIVSAILVDERLAVGYQIETLADAIVEHIATALAAKDARISELDHIANHWLAEHDKLRAQLAERGKPFIAAAEEAYWLLAWTWQSHLTGPGKPFDMSIFAPEARNMMTKAEQDLFDALSEIEP